MYKLEYLPIAKRDMVDIARYIGQELANPTAAARLSDEMIEAADGLIDFPHIHPMHYPIRPLKYDYRRLPVQNYIMFYCIDEVQEVITIARVIYARRDYEIGHGKAIKSMWGHLPPGNTVYCP